ncbi:MAG: preprotein translocase subunit SecE [Bacteroidetes bacterium]|jgi:preprotein translocase subunit SecE|uniref:Protein translocase subunit SecE n=1 Tax=Candidatus Limisoma faecipullorum TaxID=2840854 RepID=A0A9D9IQM0_9BACT|nr:preprotein translocase subunit SecE [Candidatus Limisoma faecipullorum]
MKLFKKLRTDIKESYNELVHKVSWPTRSQLVNSSVIVMVASIVLSLVIFVVDLVIDELMHIIYSI